MTPAHFFRVSFVGLRLAIATISFSWFLFCHVEHCQLTTCSVWHESLPDHSRPCQNTWAPHYAAARDWLKSKGVSALTDRSGVVYYSHDVKPTSSHASQVLPPPHPPPKQRIVLYSCYCKALRVHLEMKRSTNVHLIGLSTNKGINQRLKARQRRPSRLW